MLSNLADMASSGGPVVYILLVLSFISILLILIKVSQLWFVTSGRKERELSFKQWRSGEKTAAIASVKNGKSPADRIVAYAMEALKSGFDGPSLDVELTRQGNDELARMNHYIRALELIAMISPLLGLLGTVLGMIQSFQELALAEGAANASVLAGGIWQALLTTAAGLMVAIPAAIAAALLSARIDNAGHQIESAVGQLFLIENNPG